MPPLNSYSLSENPKILYDLAGPERAERRATIRAMNDYYSNKFPKPLVSDPSVRDDNVVINLVRRIINQAVSLFMGVQPTIELYDGPSDEPSDEVLAAWTATTTANNLPIFLHSVALMGAISGHCFCKVLPPEKEGGVPRWVLLDTSMVTAFWRADDVSKPVAYMIAWEAGRTIYRQDIFFDETAQAWFVRDLHKPTNKPHWVEDSLLEWTASYSPIIDWKNLPSLNTYYGEPDLLDADLNLHVNFLASDVLRIIDVHAHPKTIGVGVEASQVQPTAVNGFWAIPNPDAKVYNLEMTSDLAATLNFFGQLQKLFFAEGRGVDLLAFTTSGPQYLSNFFLRTIFKDALDKLDTKRNLYRNGITAVFALGMEMLGYAVTVDIEWADSLPLNDEEEVSGIEKEMGLGILSRQTAAGLRGRDWEVEQVRMAEEQADASGLSAALMRFEQGAI
jgi:hypothetical protein